MARYEVTGPDGGRYEINAPDGASEQEILAYIQQNAGQKPPTDRLDGLAQPSSEGAARFAAPQMADSAATMTAEWNTPRRRADREVASEDMGAKPLAFGIPIVGPYLEEGAAALASLPATVAEGVQRAVGIENPVRPTAWPTYDQSLERMRARNRKAEADYPVQDTVGQLAAGIVTGAPVLNRLFPAGQTMLSNIGRGAVAGAAIGGAEGYGRGEGGVENRTSSAIDNALLGGAIGGALPPVAGAIGWGAERVGNALAPTIARWRPNAVAAVDEALPQSAGAALNPTLPAGVPSRPITSPEAAFYQRIANKLSEANVRPGEIGRRLEQSDIDAIGGRSPFALVDLDDSITRLAGSFARQSPEVGNVGQRFVAGRQTGITPLEGMPPNSGIPTRQFMQRAAPIDPPAGMFERMRDNMRAALSVPQRSAYRVDKDLVDARAQMSTQNYNRAYDAFRGLNVAPVVDNVLDKWMAAANDPKQLRPIAKTIRDAVNTFKTPAGTVSDLERFQTAKELLDVKIENLLTSSVSRNRRLGGELNNFKRELLDAMDNVTVRDASGAAVKIGDLYKDARDVYSSASDLRRALEAGRGALQEGSEASGDLYRAYTTGEQQMFRVGLADALERDMARKKRGNDVTQLFQSPRAQELLSEIIPENEAMRFGRNTQSEMRTVRTTNEIFGNSKTQQRSADDEAFNQMGDVIDAIRSARSATSPTDMVLRVFKSILDRVGGFRADEATVAAQKMFTADRGELDEIIRQIEARMGPNRAAHFRSMLQRYSLNLALQTSRVAAPNAQQQPPPPVPPVPPRTP